MTTSHDTILNIIPACKTCQYYLVFRCSCPPKCRVDMPNLAEGGKDCSRHVPKKVYER